MAYIETHENDSFYALDRPANPTLAEDRPRGGGARKPLHHKGSLTFGALVGAVFLEIIIGIFMFP